MNLALLLLAQIILNPYRFGTAPTPNSLNSGLVYYYSLNESSGNRLDGEPSGTPQDLTDNNIVGIATGKLGNAALFQAGVIEYLSRPDSADTSAADIDMTWTFWLYPLAIDDNYNIIAKGSDVGDSDHEYRIYMPTDDTIRFRLSNGTTHGDVTTANASAPINTWVYVRVEHNAAANTISIELNNSGTVASESYSGGSWNSASQFFLGYLPGSASGAFRLDEVKFWKRTLTSDEQASDYNSGTPLGCCPIP